MPPRVHNLVGWLHGVFATTTTTTTMKLPFELTFLLLLPLSSLALPSVEVEQTPLLSGISTSTRNNSNVRPLVLWHGLGDSHSSPGMLEFANLVKGVHPGIFVHSIYIEENLDSDQRAGFFGNVNDQLEGVAEQLAGIDELGNGFDAIGFSQGGQFLRAYIERYNSPPVHNLLTFGAQHMGVSDLPLCKPGDTLCQIARRAARFGVYSKYAQTNLIQAQYFRDPDQLSTYLEVNEFLVSINNEVVNTINNTYAENLASLEHLVLILFSEDKTVVPKESSWFGSYEPLDESSATANAGERPIIPMRLQPTYIADTFGLRTLDERGAIVLEVCEGEHMRISDECWKPLVQRFVGGPVKDA